MNKYFFLLKKYSSIYKKRFFYNFILFFKYRLKKYHVRLLKFINKINHLKKNKKSFFFFKKNYIIKSSFKTKSNSMSSFIKKNKSKYLNFPISKKFFYNKKSYMFWLDLYYYKFFYKKKTHFLSKNFKKKIMFLLKKNLDDSLFLDKKFSNKKKIFYYSSYLQKKHRMLKHSFNSFFTSKNWYVYCFLLDLSDVLEVEVYSVFNLWVSQFKRVIKFNKKKEYTLLENKNEDNHEDSYIFKIFNTFKERDKNITINNFLLRNKFRNFRFRRKKKFFIQEWKKYIKRIKEIENNNLKTEQAKEKAKMRHLFYKNQSAYKMYNNFYTEHYTFKKNQSWTKVFFLNNNTKKNYSMLIHRKKRRKIIKRINQKNRNQKLLFFVDNYNKIKLDSKFMKKRYVYNKNIFFKIDFFSKYNHVFNSNFKKKKTKKNIFLTKENLKKKYLNLIMSKEKKYANKKIERFNNKKSVRAWKKFLKKKKHVSPNMNDKDYIYLKKNNLFFLFKTYFIYYFIYFDWFFYSRNFSYYFIYLNKNVFIRYISYIKCIGIVLKKNLIKKKKNKFFFILLKKIFLYFFNKYFLLFKKINRFNFKLNCFLKSFFLKKNNYNKIYFFLLFYKIFFKYKYLYKFFIKSRSTKINNNTLSFFLFKKEKKKKEIFFFIEYILSIFYLFHKLKKKTYINNLFFFYLNKKKINKLNLLKKNIRYRLRRKKWNFHSFFDKQYLTHSFHHYIFDMKNLIPFFIIGNNNLEKKISTYFHKNVFLYNLDNDFFRFSKMFKLISYSSKSFMMWNWVWKNRIQFLLKLFIFLIKSFLFLNIKKIFFKKKLHSFLFTYNKILIFLFNNIMISNFKNKINNILHYYVLHINKIYNINFFYDVILRFLLQNKTFYLYYMKYYILNFLYLFYYIEVTISKYINNNCFLFINYSLRWKYYLNSAKMWCEYIAYFLKKKLTIWKLFSFIKKQQKIEKNRCTYDMLAKKSHNIFLHPFRYPLKGIRILYSGNFKKAKRKRKLYYYVWLSNSNYTQRMPLKQFKFYIDYYSTSVSLKRSNVGIKFWLLFNIF